MIPALHLDVFVFIYERGKSVDRKMRDENEFWIESCKLEKESPLVCCVGAK